MIILGKKGLTPESGSILIAVLWSLFFLAALALSIHTLITPQLSLAERLRDRTVLRTAADAGTKIALIAVRSDETEAYDTLSDLWSINDEIFKEVDLSPGRTFSVINGPDGNGSSDEVRYGLIDEERKININTAPADVLNRLIETIGEASSQEADDLSDAIVDWRDEDEEPRPNGAETAYYEALERGYLCKNAAFEVLEELLLVKGMSREIFDKVSGYLTVYGEGRVNVNTAGLPVLESLGMSEGLAQKVIDFREGDDGRERTADDLYFESAQNFVSALSSKQGLSIQEVDVLTDIVNADLVTARSDHFRGRSVGASQDGGATTEVDFIVSRDEVIRYWREK